MHLLCGDTVPKYRVENGAEEGGTVRTINIHSPSTEKSGKSLVQGEIFSPHKLCLMWHHWTILVLPLLCHILDLDESDWGCSCAVLTPIFFRKCYSESCGEGWWGERKKEEKWINGCRFWSPSSPPLLIYSSPEGVVSITVTAALCHVASCVWTQGDSGRDAAHGCPVL